MDIRCVMEIEIFKGRERWDSSRIQNADLYEIELELLRLAAPYNLKLETSELEMNEVTHYSLLHQHLLGILGSLEGKRIYEIGTGTGGYLYTLKRLGAHVSGSDINGDMFTDKLEGIFKLEGLNIGYAHALKHLGNTITTEKSKEIIGSVRNALINGPENVAPIKFNGPVQFDAIISCDVICANYLKEQVAGDLFSYLTRYSGLQIHQTMNDEMFRPESYLSDATRTTIIRDRDDSLVMVQPIN
jgi:SAM-dependent methyltransferase